MTILMQEIWMKSDLGKEFLAKGLFNHLKSMAKPYLFKNVFEIYF